MWRDPLRGKGQTPDFLTVSGCFLIFRSVVKRIEVSVLQARMPVVGAAMPVFATHGRQPVAPSQFRRWGAVFALWAYLFLPAGAPAAASTEVSVDLAEVVATVARQAGLTGDDLSPALAANDTPSGLTDVLRQRPATDELVQIAIDSPPVRIYTPPLGTVGFLVDRNLDGEPDRARAALRAAERTLAFCAASGLGAPLDDGDGEVDIFFADLGGAAQGYAALEESAALGRGASGFIVLDFHAAKTGGELEGLVSRLTARLVLAKMDSAVPSWWTEASAAWVESRVRGVAHGADSYLSVRWNNPEIGVTANDPLFARGNVSLLWSIDDPALELKVVRAAWKGLSRRRPGDEARGVIEKAIGRMTGLRLEDLVLRAGLTFLVEGNRPMRVAAEISALPQVTRETALPVAPRGAAFLHLRPDPNEPEATRLSLDFGESRWTSRLLARRHDGSWHQTQFPQQDAYGEILIPWNDYDETFVILVRNGDERGSGTVRYRAESAGTTSLFALSSLGATQTPSGDVEISWTSAWEQDLFGWRIERALGTDGPWAGVNSVPMPSLGLPREGTTYSTIDGTRLDGQTVYYRVVGITTGGLAVTGPAVALRHFPSAAGR